MTRLGTVHIDGFPFYVTASHVPPPPSAPGPTPVERSGAPKQPSGRGVRSA